MNPEHMPRPFAPDYSDNGPLKMWVTVNESTETDMIRALDETVNHFTGHLDPEAIARAVNWLQSKYGNRP